MLFYKSTDYFHKYSILKVCSIFLFKKKMLTWQQPGLTMEFFIPPSTSKYNNGVFNWHPRYIISAQFSTYEDELICWI